MSAVYFHLTMIVLILRYDMDHDDDVLYCYEIQLEDSVRRKGLGKFMMKVLELMMIKSDLLKIMCTVFKETRKYEVTQRQRDSVERKYIEWRDNVERKKRDCLQNTDSM